MPCPKCSAEVSDLSAVECPHCGVVFSKIGTAHRPAPPPPPPAAAKPRARVGPWVIGAIIVIGLFKMFSRPAPASAAGWNSGYSGYEAALAQQKQSGQRMLVYFYTDW